MRPVTLDDIKTVRPKQFKPVIASGNFASAEELLRRAGNEFFAIIDVRERAAFDDGHIPEAIHIESNVFVAAGQFQPADAVQAALVEREISPHGEIVVYSERGARSAAAYFALRLAGCNSARNFIGSWYEWTAASLRRRALNQSCTAGLKNLP